MAGIRFVKKSAREKAIRFCARSARTSRSGPQHDYVADLITKIQSRTVPLSQCMAEAYRLAKSKKITSLEEFCAGELTGWYGDRLKNYYPKYRLAQVYAGINRQINMQYFGWDGTSSNVMDFIKRDTDNFKPTKLLFAQPLSELEAKIPSDLSNKIISLTMRACDFIPDTENPNIPIYVYASTQAYVNILEGIRNELTIRLMDL
ncbi:MAG: hypothetical protein JRF30_05700 [Deltaproteobacteria bacterium]|nr:hypothetical protein [Deltaproteobacteria bacterium]MBW2330417.1 hypothetical protein [Deltaproteobacteria bacterium]